MRVLEEIQIGLKLIREQVIPGYYIQCIIHICGKHKSVAFLCPRVQVYGISFTVCVNCFNVTVQHTCLILHTVCNKEREWDPQLFLYCVTATVIESFMILAWTTEFMSGILKL